MSILNLWSLGHFIQWSFLGRFVFSNWYIFFILSVGWELIELILPYEFAVETLENKISDIVVNTFGFYLGVKLKNNE
ncbi:MAG: hypothetical protein L7S41_04565 [Candidatus Thalassarchaeaceae archaeon]|jgi:hypothetical protein|nr:hypothetical protein [Candidatus Thalassarchaeaceae archaeon]